MKQPILLKTILDICFIILAFSFAVSLIATLLSLFIHDFPVPVEIAGHPIEKFSTATILLLVLKITTSGLILYTIYVLRQLIRNFFKGKLYSPYQIAALKLIGQLIILCTFATTVLDFLSELFLSEKAKLGITISLSFGSFWFVLALGLFFIYLSKIFAHAGNLQEESQLTV